MYKQRHYPDWNHKPLWIGNVVYDDQNNIAALRVLRPLVEGEEVPEWHGLIQASVFVVNPLKLRYPDNTNSGQDMELPDTRDPYQLQNFFSRLEETSKFNQGLMEAYLDGISNTAELLSVLPEDIKNYWFAGFGVLDMYKEGETPQECWDRIAKDNQVLDFMIESIVSGELQAGLQKAVHDNPDAVMPPQVNTYTPDMKQALVGQLHTFEAKWNDVFCAKVDTICEKGLKHMCKRDDETEAVERGVMTTKELFMPMLNELEQNMINPDFDGPKVNQTALDNYRILVENFKGDGYSIFPEVDENGEILLQWRIGPNKIGEAVLQGDGGMHLDLDHMEFTVSKLRAPQSIELQAQVAFDDKVLAQFIETGVLPSNE